MTQILTFAVRSLLAGLTVVALVAGFAGRSSAQIPLPGGEKKVLGVCNQPDKVETTSFALVPAQPAPGQQVSVRMTIRNKCPIGSNPLNVNWDINKNNQILGNGTKQIAPGASADFSANWTAAAGTHNFYGGTSDVMGESGANLANNTRAVPLTLVAPPATLEEKTLDYDDARNAGAQFANNRQSAPHDCGRLGQFNAEDNAMLLNGRVVAVFAAHCENLTGGKADPEVFKNFTLKNGWTIKSVTPVAETNINNGNKAGFNVITSPSVGSNNPYAKVHVWADRGGYVYMRMVMTIQGPAGTNPYQ